MGGALSCHVVILWLVSSIEVCFTHSSAGRIHTFDCASRVRRLVQVPYNLYLAMFSPAIVNVLCFDPDLEENNTHTSEKANSYTETSTHTHRTTEPIKLAGMQGSIAPSQRHRTQRILIACALHLRRTCTRARPVSFILLTQAVLNWAVAECWVFHGIREERSQELVEGAHNLVMRCI
jgi:hypothetical protein